MRYGPLALVRFRSENAAITESMPVPQWLERRKVSSAEPQQFGSGMKPKLKVNVSSIGHMVANPIHARRLLDANNPISVVSLGPTRQRNAWCQRAGGKGFIARNPARQPKPSSFWVWALSISGDVTGQEPTCGGVIP